MAKNRKETNVPTARWPLLVLDGFHNWLMGLGGFARLLAAGLRPLAPQLLQQRKGFAGTWMILNAGNSSNSKSLHTVDPHTVRIV